MNDVDMQMEAERRIRLNNQSQQMVAHGHPHRRSRWLLTQALGFWLTRRFHLLYATPTIHILHLNASSLRSTSTFRASYLPIYYSMAPATYLLAQILLCNSFSSLLSTPETVICHRSYSTTAFYHLLSTPNTCNLARTLLSSVPFSLLFCS